MKLTKTKKIENLRNILQIIADELRKQAIHNGYIGAKQLEEIARNAIADSK